MPLFCVKITDFYIISKQKWIFLQNISTTLDLLLKFSPESVAAKLRLAPPDVMTKS